MKKLAPWACAALFAASATAAPMEKLVNLKSESSHQARLVFEAGEGAANLADEVWNEASIRTLEDGESVPVITRLIRVPFGCRVEAEIDERESYSVNQAQFSLGDWRGADLRLLDEAELSSRRLSPPRAVHVGPVEVWRGVPVAPVAIFPFQRDEDAGLVENRSLELAVSFVPDPRAPQTSIPLESSASHHAQAFDGLLLNPPHRDPGEPQVSEIGRMLILYPNTQAFRERGLVWVDSLANWKRKVGYRVDVVGVDVVNQRPPAIRTMIRTDYYRNANPPIGYLLIVGSDSSQVDTWFPSYEHNRLIGDHYWSLMDDDDVYLPDIAVGRLDVHNYNELAGVVTRQLLFERQPFVEQGRQWFTKSIFTAENIAVPGGQFVPSMIHLGRWAWLRLNRAGYTVIDTLFSNNEDRSIDALTEAALRDGRSLALSRGWLSACYNVNDNRPVETGRRNPFVMSITCLSYARQSLFYRAVSANNPRGPIASFSIHGFSHSSTNNSVLGGALRSMFSFNQDKVGLIQNFGKFQLWHDNVYGLNDIIVETLSNYRLMGDPTTAIYTAAPADVQVEHPRSLIPGETGINVHVSSGGSPVADAWVCVWQVGREHLAARPGDDGWARFTFGNQGLAAGNLFVTVTGRNRMPYATSLPVEASPAMVTLASVAFDNQDGLFANGESVPTTLTLRNAGNSDLANVTVNLSTEDDWTTFSREQAVIENLARGAAAQVSFDLLLHRSSKAGRQVRVDVGVTAGQNAWTHAFNFTSSGFRFDVPLTAVPDQNFRRGETARIIPRLRNLGDLRTPELRAQLISRSLPYVRVAAGDAQFSAMNAEGGTADANGDLRVQISPLAIPGNYANLALALRGVDGNDAFRDTVEFTIRIGEPAPSDPYGPDAYGYICFDSFDRDWQKVPAYEWLEINPNKPNPAFQGTRLPMNDNAVDRDTTFGLPLPFTFRYYGQEFDTVAVNSNGWIAFGSEMTMFPDFRNQRIPGIMGPDAQVSVFWQDLINSGNDWRGVFVHSVDSLGIYIVEWSDLQIYPQENPDTLLVEFQVILYNPAVYPTATGDGEIKMQYKTVHHFEGDRTDNLFFTVGIKNLDNTDGLQYAYWNNYSPACRRLENRMALLFTTEREISRGGARGRVVRREDNQAGIGGVDVTFERFGASTTTDNEGNFLFERVPVGTDRLILTRSGFNRELVQNVTIFQDSVVTINASMTHPQLSGDFPPIEKSLQPGNRGTTFGYSIQNSGNGPLEWTLSTRYADGNETQYARIWEMNISQAADIDRTIYGVEIVGDKLFVSGGGDRNDEDDNRIYVVNRNRQIERSFAQNSQDGSGLRDLAYDGTLLWGAERVGANDTLRLVGFNAQGETVRVLRPVISRNDLDIPWGLTWSPERGTFFIGNGDQNLFEVSAQGGVLRRFELRLPRAVAKVRGLAWNPVDPDRMPLLILDDVSEQMGMRLVKADPTGGEAAVVAVLPNERNFRGSGLSIGYDWERSQTVLAAVDGGLSNRLDDDHIRLFEIGPDIHFMRLNRFAGISPAGGVGGFQIELRAEGLALGEYALGLFLQHNGAEDPVLIPLRLEITNESGLSDEVVAPLTFQMEQPFPNPFNHRSTVAFTLPSADQVRLTVYDIAGREVRSMDLKRLASGRHSVSLDLEGISAGVYLCRLQAGSQTMTRRMVLLP